MYEAHFGMTWRPFRTAPDPSCFIPVADFQEHIHSILNCLTSAQGIAVLTADAGLGKTLVARRVIAELENSYHTIFLGNSNFDGLSSMLQAILHQLVQPYLQMTEYELRLAVKSAITSLPLEKEALVLVIDEAHLVDDQLLEELRVLTDLTRNGVPLVRLLLVGQLELEESLSQPTLAALSQRVRCQIVLEPLRRHDAAAYVIQHFDKAGAAAAEILTEEGLELICHASDGSPRCLNQLCDHCLTLAYIAQQDTISTHLIREAVEDLQQLPLRWNALPAELSTTTRAPADSESDRIQPPAESDSDASLQPQVDVPTARPTVHDVESITDAVPTDSTPPINGEGEHVNAADSYAIEFGAGIPMDPVEDAEPVEGPGTVTAAQSATDRQQPSQPIDDPPEAVESVVFEFGAETDEQDPTDDPAEQSNSMPVTSHTPASPQSESTDDDQAAMPPNPIVPDRVELEPDDSTQTEPETVMERQVVDPYARFDADQHVDHPANSLADQSQPQTTDDDADEDSAETWDRSAPAPDTEATPAGHDGHPGLNSESWTEESPNLLEDIMPLVSESITTMEQLASSGDWVTTTGLERLSQVADDPEQSTPRDSEQNLGRPHGEDSSRPEMPDTERLESEIGNELLELCQEVHLTMSHAPNARRSRVGRVAAELQEVLNSEPHLAQDSQFDVVEPEPETVQGPQRSDQHVGDRTRQLFSRVRRQRYSDNQLH